MAKRAADPGEERQWQLRHYSYGRSICIFIENALPCSTIHRIQIPKPVLETVPVPETVPVLAMRTFKFTWPALPLTHQQVLVNSPLLSYVQMEMKKKTAVTLTRLAPYVHRGAWQVFFTGSPTPTDMTRPMMSTRSPCGIWFKIARHLVVTCKFCPTRALQQQEMLRAEG